MEHAVLQMGIILLKLFDQILNILSLGVSIHRAWILAHRKLILILQSNNIRLNESEQLPRKPGNNVRYVLLS